MTAIYEGARGIYLATQVQILDTSKELAWAESHVVENPHLKWMLGRYAEADRPNQNRQHFAMSNLKFGQPLLTHAPLNINHGPLVVGAFVASEIVYPMNEESEEGLNPFMEALSVFWKHYFPDEYRVVESAHKSGNLFYSMECVPKSIGCTGANGCNKYFDYDGRRSHTYCACLNDPNSGVEKDLVEPHFAGGALIVPPVRPGWHRADIKQISQIVHDHAEAVERLYADIEVTAPESEAEMWEAVMLDIIREAETNAL